MNCHASLGKGAADGEPAGWKRWRAELGNTVAELLQQAKQTEAISIGGGMLGNWGFVNEENIDRFCRYRRNGTAGRCRGYGDKGPDL